MRALLFLSFLIINNVKGQDPDMIVISAGKYINEAVSPNIAYHYPQFAPGKIFFKDGKTASGKVNYNKLVDEIQFINKFGDTLAISNESTILHVAVNNDTFYYDQGFIKVINSTGPVKLALKPTLRLIENKTIGAYDMPDAAALNALSTYYDGNSFQNLPVKKDIALKNQPMFFFGNGNNKFLPANRKNFLEMFPTHREKLKNYLKDKVVDFNSATDLQNIVTAMNQ